MYNIYMNLYNVGGKVNSTICLLININKVNHLFTIMFLHISHKCQSISDYIILFSLETNSLIVIQGSNNYLIFFYSIKYATNQDPIMGS